MSLPEVPSNFNPAKSTVYIANLPYDLKTNEIQDIFDKYGKIIKVTLLTVKETRKSKGVAFVLFANAEDAKKCVENTHNTMMGGQMLRASLAKDNGRRPNLNKKPVIEHKKQHNFTPY